MAVLDGRFVDLDERLYFDLIEVVKFLGQVVFQLKGILFEGYQSCDIVLFFSVGRNAHLVSKGFQHFLKAVRVVHLLEGQYI